MLRTFLGHAKGVRDITFNNDGTRFLSASYDRYVKLWDTETGQCISKFSNRKIPYVVKFNPDADKQHMFLAGCNDKKIIQVRALVSRCDMQSGAREISWCGAHRDHCSGIPTLAR